MLFSHANNSETDKALSEIPITESNMLREPLYHQLLFELQASLATWVTILRIMGDLPEADFGESIAVPGVGRRTCTLRERLHTNRSVYSRLNIRSY